jgi:hypothetical protein
MLRLPKETAPRVLDVLSGRLTFERTCVKLHDAVIEKIGRLGDRRFLALVPTLRRHRDEEKEHEEWLEGCVRELGGTAHETTDMGRLEAEESQGIQSVIIDGHTRVLDLLHALLAAELSDNAGWDLLVKLSGDLGDRETRVDFAKRLAEETKHLAFIREAVIRATEMEITGTELEMPTSPLAAAAWPAAKSLVTALVAFGAVAAAGFMLGRRFA